MEWTTRIRLMTQGCSRYASVKVGFLLANLNVLETLRKNLHTVVRDTACGIWLMGLPIADTDLPIKRKIKMLDNYHQEIGSMAKECKPDFEQLILSARNSLGKNQNFQDAIFLYLGDIRLNGKMAELLGELVSESRQIKSRIDSLIKQQEKEE